MGESPEAWQIHGYSGHGVTKDGRKFDEGRSMDGNKSYYLSESRLIYRAVRAENFARGARYIFT